MKITLIEFKKLIKNEINKTLKEVDEITSSERQQYALRRAADDHTGAERQRGRDYADWQLYNADKQGKILKKQLLDLFIPELDENKIILSPALVLPKKFTEKINDLYEKTTNRSADLRDGPRLRSGVQLSKAPNEADLELIEKTDWIGEADWNATYTKHTLSRGSQGDWAFDYLWKAMPEFHDSVILKIVTLILLKIDKTKQIENMINDPEWKKAYTDWKSKITYDNNAIKIDGLNWGWLRYFNELTKEELMHLVDDKWGSKFDRNDMAIMVNKANPEAHRKIQVLMVRKYLSKAAKRDHEYHENEIASQIQKESLRRIVREEITRQLRSRR